MTNKTKKLITHNGTFHTDDIFSAATLSLVLEKENIPFEIIRTRNEELIKNGDFVFDVGGKYDEELNRFDHHQVGGAGKRENGIEYSSFGLVWKKFGKILVEEKIADFVDQQLVAPIDAFDNGFSLAENKYATTPYYIQHMFFSMVPTWREVELNNDEMFLKSVEMAKIILSREIIQARDAFWAKEIIARAYHDAKDKRIIILDKDYLSDYVLNDFPETLFVIYERSVDQSWGVKAVRKNAKTFDNRKDFPRTWAGLRDEELKKVTNVLDAVFCHRGLFLVVAKSKEGAIKLAQIAVE